MKQTMSVVICASMCLMTPLALAEPGDVPMPDPVLEAEVETIIGDDGVPGAVDGNWLVGDGGSSAGPGLNDPDGLTQLGDLGTFTFPMGVTDLTGLDAATNLGLLILGFGDIQSLTPIANLPGIFGLVFVNAGIGDTELAELAAGWVAPMALMLMNEDPDITPNMPTTAGINSIGQIGSLMELGVNATGNDLDISGLSGLSLGDIGLGLGLSLGGNNIVGGWDIIDGFTGLTSLSLGGTGMDSTELALIDWMQMVSLAYLDLTVNEITDIAPLTGLIGAAPPGVIELGGNNLDKAAVCTHIPALETAGFTVNHSSAPCGPELTLTMSGTGQISPEPGVYRYTTGEEVFLSAMQISGGGIFSHWTGNVQDTQSASTSIIMNTDESVEAVFIAGDWTLTMQHSGAGTGATYPEPGVWAKEDGDTVFLTYTVEPGNFWGGWQGDAAGILPTLLTMDSDKSVTAIFGDSGYDLTIAVDGPGNTNPPAGAYSLATGTVVDITASVNDFTYLFHHWSGNIGAADPNAATLQVTLDQARSVTAVFRQPVLTINVTGNGSTNPAAGEHTYPANDLLNIWATPDPGWRFDHWEGDAAGMNPETGLSMDGDKTITAVFTLIPAYELTINVEGSGITDPVAGMYIYEEGSPPVVITAEADEGWYFDGWSGDIGSADPGNPMLMVTMDQDRVVTAAFAQYDWSLTLQVDGNGTLDPSAGVYYYNDGASQTVRATAGAIGWAFDRWTGDIEGATYDPNLNLIGLPMDRNRVVTAVFVEANWELTIILEGVGAPSPATGTYTYGNGATVYLFAGWAPGQEATTAFDRWSGDLESTAQYVPLMMNSNKTITANYAAADWTLTVEHGGDGSGSTFPIPGVYGFLDGRRTGIPVQSIAPGSYWGGWQGDASGYDLVYVMTMDGNKVARAMFETSGYTLTINIPSGSGSTSPAAGPHPYVAGATPTIKATPANAGWEFDRWEGDLGEANPYYRNLTLVMDRNRAVTPYFLEGTACDTPAVSGKYPLGGNLCFYVPDPVAPASTFQWFKNGEPLSDGQVIGAQSRSLYLTNLQVSDSGAYTCEYDDGAKAAAVYGPVNILVQDSEAIPAMDWRGLLVLAAVCIVVGVLCLTRTGRRILAAPDGIIERRVL